MNSLLYGKHGWLFKESLFDTMTVISIVPTENVNYQTHEWHRAIKTSN